MAELPEGIEAIEGCLAGKHIVSADQFSRPDIEMVFAEADAARDAVNTVPDDHPHRLMMRTNLEVTRGRLVNLFYEPSTRTIGSFNAAMTRLGGTAEDILDDYADPKFSSAVKGEDFADTIQAHASTANLIVLRHPVKGFALDAARVSPVPILNGGDGPGEHPTQALLDISTIRREQGGRVDGLHVATMGDALNGRTVHSLARVLALFDDVTLHYIAPPEIGMPEDLFQELNDRGLQQEVHEDPREIIEELDVLYALRLQKERFSDHSEYERLKGRFVVDTELMGRAKPTMTLMHPLPRNEEISREVDSDPRAAYFRQMEEGMYVRMALIAGVMGKSLRGYVRACNVDRQRNTEESYHG